eukprot:gnl/TRDRNA2_/TRDRNA2_159624_c0_seq1.p3 gnl/TRDRNA2_/TRDRNA2_159624_c0~~gnl/TRDRNA2_/TRDRNA2_159624_c0_seq1.p3  ORF type:complete len:182 (-),score=38.31 gnl/TRDRNA2_/TRDRNA2_159624_c0_seq1:729-1274(-)
MSENAPASVTLLINDDSYEALQVPYGCTVGRWKQLIADGFVGKTKILYTQKLRCHKCDGEKLQLQDEDPLPAPPAKMRVLGPCPVMQMLEMALKKSRQAIPDVDPESNRRRLGQYWLGGAIGWGFEGACIYHGEHVQDGTEVAVKWPATEGEVQALQNIDRRAPAAAPGLPHLLAHGVHRG